MIASIHGILEGQRGDQLIIRVGGFGVRVAVPSSTLAHLGEMGTEVTLYTHFQVREDGMALYGFANEADRDAFELLITVSGVGPKVALGLLSVMDATAFYRAIIEDNQLRLSQGPGVGKKLAARLVLELKSKVPAALIGLGETAGAGGAPGVSRAEVLEALIGLGYNSGMAQAALAKLPPDPDLSLEQQITLALRALARGL